MLCLQLSILSLFSVAQAGIATDPTLPAGWSSAPGHCLGPSGCTSSHCNCSPPPHQLAYTDCSADECVANALKACQSNSKCKSFAVMTGSTGHYAYELYDLNNWSFVPNSDWNAYAVDSAEKPPGWTPPPPPTPECTPGPSTCKPAPAGSVFPPPGDFPPGCNHKGCTTVPTLMPTWKPTYQMNKSTIIMPCNGTGSTDPQSTKGWAYVDFDWSNWKGLGDSDGWAKAKPMDCEERMVKQVEMTVAASPDTKVFVYRNMIKALPWFTSVREKISDPKYAPWFMNFSAEVIANHSKAHVPVCDDNYKPPLCSNLYHDQSQTPGYPHGDGNCAAPACDVGGVPVGEYLFDHRNANVSINGQTFIEWFVDEYYGGNAGIGNENIIGFYIDDDWGNMNKNGPSEMNGYAMQDMGLTADDLKTIVPAYNWVANTVYHAIQEKGKWAWDLFLNNDPNCINCGDCPQPWVKKETCAADLRAYGVNASSPMQSRALLYGFSPGSCHGVNPSNLTEVEQDVANFLLIRGKYAYLGNGWTGCGHFYEYPAEQFNADYGEPLGLAKEVEQGIFVREWTKSTIKMDCNTYTPTITFK